LAEFQFDEQMSFNWRQL